MDIRYVNETDHTKAAHDALGISHASLSDITPSDHHVRYSDAEAIAAVEAEPTLDLTGVIPNSAYPNALLLDGSRKMTGSLAPATYGLYDLGTEPFQFRDGFFSRDINVGRNISAAGGTAYLKYVDIATLGSFTAGCNLLPKLANTYDLGYSAQEWRHGKFKGTVYVDTIAEITAAAGVTIDGVLCKDGAIPETAVPVLKDAKYPNALLLDGSREMVSGKKISWAVGANPHPYITNWNPFGAVYDESIYFFTWNYCTFAGTSFYFNALEAIFNLSSIKFGKDGQIILSEFDLPFKVYDGVSAYQTVMDLVRASTPYVDILLCGDISLINDKFLKIGRDSDGTLPTPDASYRGKLIRVEGGAGVADLLYCCMKSAADTYSWVQVASG